MNKYQTWFRHSIVFNWSNSCLTIQLQHQITFVKQFGLIDNWCLILTDQRSNADVF